MDESLAAILGGGYRAFARASPLPQDAPAVIEEYPLPILPSRAAEPFKYGQLRELNDAHEVWDNKGKGPAVPTLQQWVSYVRLEG